MIRANRKLNSVHVVNALTELSQAQADYIGVPRAGPFKPGHYRYRAGGRPQRSA